MGVVVVASQHEARLPANPILVPRFLPCNPIHVQFDLETRYFYQIGCQSCSNVGSEDWIINNRTCAPPSIGMKLGSLLHPD